MHRENEANRNVTLHAFLDVIARRSNMILLSTGIAAALAVMYSFTMSSLYSATAKILPPQQEMELIQSMVGQMGNLGMLAGDVLGKGNKAEMYAEILKSQVVMDPIIDRFQLMNLYRQKYRQNTYDKLERTTKIEVGKKSGIISITIEDKSPQRAAVLANAYVEELDKVLRSINVSGAGQSRSFLNQRLETAKEELAKAGDTLKAFQSKHKMIGMEKQVEATIQVIAELSAQLSFEESRLAAYRRQFTDTNQKVKNSMALVNSLRTKIAELEGTKSGDVIPSFGSVPEIGQEYLRIMREFKTNEAIVETLTKQYQLARLSEANTISPLQFVQTAKAPDFKSGPSKRKFVMLVTLSVLFLATAFAFVLENLAKMTAEDRERWRNSARCVPFLKKFV